MKGISKKDHDILCAKFAQIAFLKAGDTSSEAAANALSALREKYQEYESLIDSLRECIAGYDELNKELRAEILVPALREKRKAARYSTNDFESTSLLTAG